MNGNNAQPLITCRDVKKVYGSGNAEVHALRGVNLDVYPGEITMLVGPSGCGKTTLLSIIAGILRPTSGSVLARARNSRSYRPGGELPSVDKT